MNNEFSLSLPRDYHLIFVIMNYILQGVPGDIYFSPSLFYLNNPEKDKKGGSNWPKQGHPVSNTAEFGLWPYYYIHQM